jgi:MinD-like ATPase involved in chromosome partitioning or flagellar assembly
MAAAAIVGRITAPALTRRRRAGAALAFDELDGPLVAVCGLTGGAGTTTLALLLAHQAAAASAAPILLTEADPVRPGLAALTGAATPHPLIELAQQTANDAAPQETFLELEPRLRLIAAAPRPSTTTAPAAVQALLSEARAAHGLVIVDCSTTWTADSPILASATHILWSTPATPAGLARARAVLDSDLMPAAGRAVEALVATAHHPRACVSVRALRRLAARRCERLVLIPHSDAATRGELACDDAIAHALNGLARTLRRQP